MMKIKDIHMNLYEKICVYKNMVVTDHRNNWIRECLVFIYALTFWLPALIPPPPPPGVSSK